MTFRWRTFSSALLAIPLSAACVSGVVRIAQSPLPAMQQGRDNSGVVVWLDPAHAADEPSPHVTTARFEMRQKDKRFIPHVLAVPVGAEVQFPNSDPIFHSVFSNFSGQIFDFGLYAPGSTRSVKFTRPGVVRLFCNIHPSMSAVIVVLPTRWFATSDKAGVFAIQDVPPGDYVLHAFHERATEDAMRSIERRVSVSDKDSTLAPLTISDLGYLAEPHKNKYGQDYPPDSGVDSAYPHAHK
jgi:plastocyanin